MNWLPSIDIVVPCYNVDHIVEQCIDSLLQQSYDKNTIAIYLVNDGSTDTTGEILNSFSHHHHINIIHYEKNRGLSAARNTGIKSGTGEVIIFLDSDRTVQPNWISEHINILRNNNVVGVIGDSQLPHGNIPTKLDSYLYDPRRGARRFGEGTPIRFPYFLLNNTSLKRSVFDVIEFFDENIMSYGGEDTELAIRLWEAYPDGLRFSFSATCEHHHHRELNDYCNLMYGYGKTNLPSLLEQFPQYNTELGGQWIKSIKGYLLFNPIVRFWVAKTRHFRNSFWLSRYLVIDAVIRGARTVSRR